MPDIVSKIRVEAIGADQAAREIRKLKDAYTEVAAAAKGISPEAVGGDAFAKAVNPPGTSEDIIQRESRSKAYREQVRERETAGRGGLGGISQAMQATEAAATGRGGGAVGSAATGIGSMIGGTLGVGLLAGGMVAMGAQKFAENAYGRMENIYGTGISQRLGRSYEDIQNVQTGYGRAGIPFGMVQSFFQSASQTGLSMNRPGALGATNIAMEAMASMGVDPGTIAGLMGGISKAGMNLGRVDYDMFGQAAKSMGRENVGTYLQEMARGITAMSTQGIDITEKSLTRQTNILSALSQFGGMTPEGAAAASQLLQSKAVGAARLQRPEDIIAFQRMRKATGMSITETMMAMEGDPEAMARTTYSYLKDATGGNQEEMRLRFQRFLGEGTTMGMSVSIMEAIEKTMGMDPAEAAKVLGAGTPWMNKSLDEAGNWVPNDPARQTTAVRQSELLRSFEESMLELTTDITKSLREAFSGPLNMSTIGMTWKGTKTPWADISDVEAQVQNVSRQDVSAVFVELEAKNLSFGSTMRELAFLGRPEIARSKASGAYMRADPDMMSYVGGIYEEAGLGSLFGKFQTGQQQSLGSWGFMTSEIGRAMSKKAQEEAYGGVMEEGGTRASAHEAKRAVKEMFDELLKGVTPDTDMKLAEAIDLWIRLMEASGDRGIVHTDGESDYSDDRLRGM